MHHRAASTTAAHSQQCHIAILPVCLQLGRAPSKGGKKAVDSEVRLQHAAHFQVPAASPCKHHLLTPHHILCTQAELARQTQYPNLMDPHRLKGLTVRSQRPATPLDALHYSITSLLGGIAMLVCQLLACQHIIMLCWSTATIVPHTCPSLLLGVWAGHQGHVCGIRLRGSALHCWRCSWQLLHMGPQ